MADLLKNDENRDDELLPKSELVSNSLTCSILVLDRLGCPTGIPGVCCEDSSFLSCLFKFKKSVIELSPLGMTGLKSVGVS